MVDTQEFMPKAPSLRAKDLKVGDIARIYDTELFVAEDSGRRQLMARVKFKGEDRTIYFNKVTVQQLAGDIGKDSEDWVGRDIAVLKIEPTRMGDSVIWSAKKK